MNIAANNQDLPPLVKKIRSHLVLIYNKSSESGSGVLVRLQNKVFVLTAAHVISDDIKINLSPWHYGTVSIKNIWINSKLDIGFIELNPFEVDILKNDELEGFKIEQRISSEVNTLKRNIAICGYPSALASKQDNRITLTPVYFGCVLLHPENWPLKLQEFEKYKDVHLVIPYGTKNNGGFFDLNNKLLDPIDPHGLSGCGIWHYVNTEEFIDNPRYGLAGILTSYFPQSQILVGTQIDILINEIKNKYGFI